MVSVQNRCDDYSKILESRLKDALWRQNRQPTQGFTAPPTVTVDNTSETDTRKTAFCQQTSEMCAASPEQDGGTIFAYGV